jgi:hypothetical protein
MRDDHYQFLEGYHGNTCHCLFTIFVGVMEGTEYTG